MKTNINIINTTIIIPEIYFILAIIDYMINTQNCIKGIYLLEPYYFKKLPLDNIINRETEHFCGQHLA